MAQVAWRLGVNVALGTDWLPSGSMNMARELACADSFNKTYLDGFFSDEDLWLMVTRNAARATHDDNKLGTLAKGLAAATWPSSTAKQQHAISRRLSPPAAEGRRCWCCAAGSVSYGDAALITAPQDTASCDDHQRLRRQTRAVCLPPATSGENLATLQQRRRAPAPTRRFSCDTPLNEPTCTPSRPMAVNGSTTYTGKPGAGDMDGDGIDDASDDCPTVFNPIRPLDNGKQADADADGAGDACDAAPMDATPEVAPASALPASQIFEPRARTATNSRRCAAARVGQAAEIAGRAAWHGDGNATAP